MATTTTCNFCNLPLDPGDDAPRTFTEDLGGNWQIAGYTNAAGCEHYREERAADGHADTSEWWASLGHGFRGHLRGSGCAVTEE